MTYKDSSEAQSALQSKLNASPIAFSNNVGVRGSEALTDGGIIKIPVGTAPEDAIFNENLYFKYATVVSGRPSSLSKHTLFDGLQWVEANSKAVIEQDGTKFCAYKDLKPRNTSPMANCYTLLTVTDKDGNRAQLPFFTKDVTLRAVAVKALVPKFNGKRQTIDNVKYIEVEPAREGYCVLQ